MRARWWWSGSGARPFDNPHHAGRCLRGRKACPARDWERLHAWYRAEVELVDQALGGVFAALQARGRHRPALVVLLSDHGEGFDPGRVRIHHGGRLHGDQLRVPLLIAGPGIRPGRSAAPVSLVDVMPTLLAHLGLPVPDRLDGRAVTLTPGRAVEKSDRPRLAAEHHFLWRDGERIRVPRMRATALRRAVIAGNLWFLNGLGGAELYDVVSDPEQRRDLAPGGVPDRLRRLADATRDDEAVAGFQVDDDEELREQLRALGYVE